MTDASPASSSADLERPEIVTPELGGPDNESIDHPAKLMRIGAMMKQLLAEVRVADLDEASRHRLREIYEISLAEIGSALSPDLRDELDRLSEPFGADGTPSTAELQVAKAQLVGWLEGLIQGMQAMLFAQQMTAQQQLASMRGQLPSGTSLEGGRSGLSDESRPGTYL